MIDAVRISLAGRDQLITLKRRTGLKYWNELGRWALCRSLAEPTSPPDIPIATEGGIEIDWRTFAGRYADLYLDLLCQRCVIDGIGVEAQTVQRQMQLHLHRGIGYLVGDPALGKASEGSPTRRATGAHELIAAGLSTAAVGDARASAS